MKKTTLILFFAILPTLAHAQSIDWEKGLDKKQQDKWDYHLRDLLSAINPLTLCFLVYVVIAGHIFALAVLLER